jgi:RAD51-like protein 2
MARCAETGLSYEDALVVLEHALPHAAGTERAFDGMNSARELYQKEKSIGKIITFSAGMDKMLGGGVPLGQVTEFCGVPGIGKTQIGIQLAINVQLPVAFSGLDGEAVYIDTEGSFSKERFSDMAQGFLQHLRKVSQARRDPERERVSNAMTVQEMMKKMHYFRVRDASEQLSVVEVLPSFLLQHPRVKIVVMDSVAFHFRQDFDDFGARTRILNQMSQQLMSLANSYQLAVVLMNQMTTRIAAEGQSRLVPALGDSWAHAATNRILLYWKDESRFAFLFKSPIMPASTSEYIVTGAGIRTKKPRNQ